METSETPLDPPLWYYYSTPLLALKVGALPPYFFEQGGWSPPCPPGSYAPDKHTNVHVVADSNLVVWCGIIIVI